MKVKQKPKRKTRKSITKRFKITKNGKILRRKPGQNHFRAKKTGNKKMALRKFIEVSVPESKIIRKALGIKNTKKQLKNQKLKIKNTNQKLKKF